MDEVVGFDADLAVLAALMARPAEFSPWGKRSESVKTTVPESVHGDLLRAANRYGMSVSEFTFKVLLVALYGRDEVECRYLEMVRSMGEIGSLTGLGELKGSRGHGE